MTTRVNKLCSMLVVGLQTNNQIRGFSQQNIKHITTVTRNYSSCNKSKFGFSCNFELPRSYYAFKEMELTNEYYLTRYYSQHNLPPHHQKRVRVEPIFHKVINALNVGLKLKRECTISGKDVSISSNYNGGEEAVGAMMKKIGRRYGRNHLEGRDWELILVDSEIGDDYDNSPLAMYFLGTGKILMSVEGLENYSDAYIAYTLGHEVGHGVTLDSQTNLMNAILVNTHLWPERASEPSLDIKSIVARWYTRRMELVADYVGIMLMASAGYNPIEIVRDLRECKYSPSEFDFFTSVHPSPEITLKYLNRMIFEEAIPVYLQVKSAYHWNKNELVADQMHEYVEE